LQCVVQPIGGRQGEATAAGVVKLTLIAAAAATSAPARRTVTSSAWRTIVYFRKERPMKLSAFLRQAKTGIEARGWIQDALETKDGVCTWGAIHRAGIELGALYQQQGRRLHFNFVTPMAQLFSPRATDSHATILEREALYLIAEATGQPGQYGAMNIPRWND